MKGNPRVDTGLLLLRLGLGLVVLVYGCQKMFGLFHGPGYAGTIDFMRGMGIHPVFANLAIAAEFFGALGVLVGLLTPIASFGLVCNFGVVLYFNSRAGGLEKAFQGGDPSKILFPVTLLFLSLAILVLGAGKFSLDSKFFRRGK